MCTARKLKFSFWSLTNRTVFFTTTNLALPGRGSDSAVSDSSALHSTELDEIKHQLEEVMGRQELQRQMSRVRLNSECRSDDGSHGPRATSR